MVRLMGFLWGGGGDIKVSDVDSVKFTFEMYIVPSASGLDKGICECASKIKC